MKFNKIIVTSFLALILSACGGSSGGSLQPLPDGNYQVTRLSEPPVTLFTCVVNGFNATLSGRRGSARLMISTSDDGQTWVFNPTEPDGVYFSTPSPATTIVQESPGRWRMIDSDGGAIIFQKI